MSPANKKWYRQREMDIWLKLVPKLHLSGAEHTFPSHNILLHIHLFTFLIGIRFGLQGIDDVIRNQVGEYQADDERFSQGMFRRTDAQAAKYDGGIQDYIRENSKWDGS